LEPKPSDRDLENVLALLDELIQQQRSKVLATARRAVPHLTAEDVLNPQDFPDLAAFPEFHYEDGILAGYIAAQMAIRARLRAARA
jgi:hypothetical protein